MSEDVGGKVEECLEDAVSESGDVEKDPWFLSQLFKFRAMLLAKCEEKVLKREQLAAFLENLGKAMNHHGFEFKEVPATRMAELELMFFGKRQSSLQDDRVTVFNRDYGRRPERSYDHPRLLLSNFLEGLVEMVRSSKFADEIRDYARSCKDENPHVDYGQLLSQIQFFSLLDEVIFSEEMGARGTIVLMASACSKSAFKALWLGQFHGLDCVTDDPLRNDEAETDVEDR